MTESKQHLDTSDLLHELQRVQTLLPLGEADTPVLMVARLAPGLDLAAWHKLEREASLIGWQALELRNNGEYCCQWQEMTDGRNASLQLAAFMQQLSREVLRAKRGQSELSLIIVSPCETTDNGVEDIIAHLRDSAEVCDSFGNLGEGRYALLLPGAGIYKAQEIAESLCARMHNSFPSLRAGVACARGISAEAATLLCQAVRALEDAVMKGISVGARTASPCPELSTETLVQNNEKRFLFGGTPIV